MIEMDRYPVYHCLLILTDGCIHDLRKTVDKIVLLTAQPLSIIIVGIGDADFSAMETLDSDEYVLVDGNGELNQSSAISTRVRLKGTDAVPKAG